jgi:hypothetical protein
LSLGRSRTRSVLWPWVCLALIAGLSLGIYVQHTQTIVDGWDPLAYLYAGNRIAEGEGPTLCHSFNESIGPYFTLAGFNVQVRDGPCLSLNYPPGFPLILAGAELATGTPDAGLYVPALLGTFGLLVTFGLGAVLFNAWIGAASAATVAFLPTYLGASTAPWSDVAGAVFVIGGVVAYLWAEGQPTMSAKRCVPLIVLGAGSVVFGLLIRYTNVVVLIPVTVYVLVSQKRDAFRSTSNGIYWGLILLGLAGVLVFNGIYFGGFLTTGYSPEHGWYTWPAFSPRYALGPSPVGGRSLGAATKTLVENLGWLVLAGGLGLILMPRRKSMLLAGVILSYVFVYGLYAFAPEGINARFLIPTFPALAVSVAFGMSYGVLRWGWRDPKGALWLLAGGVLLVIAVLLPLPARLQALEDRNADARRNAEAVRELVEDREPNAVFLAYGLNDAIFFHGGRTTLNYRRIPPLDVTAGVYRWDQLEPGMVDAVSELLRRGVPVYYVQDSDPPFADSLELLDRHFNLNALETASNVYRVDWDRLGP